LDDFGPYFYSAFAEMAIVELPLKFMTSPFNLSSTGGLSSIGFDTFYLCAKFDYSALSHSRSVIWLFEVFS